MSTVPKREPLVFEVPRNDRRGSGTEIGPKTLQEGEVLPDINSRTPANQMEVLHLRRSSQFGKNSQDNRSTVIIHLVTIPNFHSKKDLKPESSSKWCGLLFYQSIFLGMTIVIISVVITSSYVSSFL